MMTILEFDNPDYLHNRLDSITKRLVLVNMKITMIQLKIYFEDQE